MKMEVEFFDGMSTIKNNDDNDRPGRKPTYFGHVNVDGAKVTIVDVFAAAQFELQTETDEPIRNVQTLFNEAVLLLTDRRVIKFTHRDESLQELRIADDEKDMSWEWSASSIFCFRSVVPTATPLASDYWPHWLACQRRCLQPTFHSVQTADKFLACSLYDVFLICNHDPIDSNSSGRISIRKIFDLRQNALFIEDNLPGTAIKISVGNDHLAVMVRNKDRTHLYLYGSGNHGEMGRGNVSSATATFEPVDFLNEIDPIVDVSAGGWHTCVLTDKGDVYGWGWNRCSQLGYSPEEFSIQPVPYPFDLDRPAVGIACGDESSLIQFDDGTARIFGGCEVDPIFFTEMKAYYF